MSRLLCCLITAPLWAQVPRMVCATQQLSPPTLRAESLTDLIDDVVLICTGGDPATPVSVNLQIFANTNITSRLLDNGDSEATLLLGDPPPGSQELGRNVFRARQVGPNSVVWQGISIQPPGNEGLLTIRLKNIRLNQSQLGVGPLGPTLVQVLVTATGGLAISQPYNAAFVAPTYKTSLERCDGSGAATLLLPPASSLNTDLLSPALPSGEFQFAARFSEAHVDSFRPRVKPRQNDPAFRLAGTESGFVLNDNDPAGQATQGTRFYLRILNVPDGVSVFVSTSPLRAGTSTSPAIHGELTQADATGAGPFARVPATATGRCSLIQPAAETGVAQVPVAGGAAQAVWEITASDSAALEHLSFGVAFAYRTPVAGTVSIVSGLAPLGTVATASRAAPVPRFVDTALPVDVVFQLGLTFTGVAGGGAVPPGSVPITVARGPGTQISTRTATLSGGPQWLSAAPLPGASPLIQPSSVEIRVNPTGLTPGFYHGSVQVVASSFPGPIASARPQEVSVVLDVLAAGSNPGVVLSQTGIVFTADPGETALQVQTITVSNISSVARPFTAAVSTQNGGAWLSVTTAGGIIAPDTPSILSVRANPAGLPAGVYRGAVAIVSEEGTRQVDIRLVIAPRPTASPQTARAAHSGCVPQVLVPVVTLGGAGFTVPAGPPVLLQVRVLDDCRHTIDNGDVTVEFSSGDAPRSLDPIGNGNYIGSWTPVRSADNVVLTAKATSPSPPLTGDIQVNGRVTTDQQTPVLYALLNGASFSAGEVAPGSFVSLFGANLARETSLAPEFPLPGQIDDTSVVIGGRLAPLAAVTPSQINAILPADLAEGVEYPLLVRRGTARSTALSVRIIGRQPGVFTTAGNGLGQAAVVRPDGTLAERSTPARRGETIAIYCTGLGLTVPAVESGAPAPVSLAVLAPSLAPTSVTIGGFPAEVTFAGLTPGYSGLYQVNAVVPLAAPSGQEVPVILAVAGRSTQPVTIAIE